MIKKSVPFTCIPNFAKEKLRLADNLSFDLQEVDGELSISVEATRLGADKRKITGWAMMNQYQILRLWAGLDALIKERGLADQVQTEDEYDQERLERNQATNDQFMKHRQRMVLSQKKEALNEDQRAVAQEVIDLYEDDFRKCPVSIVNDVSHRLLGYVFTPEERKPVGSYILDAIRKSDVEHPYVKLSSLSNELQYMGQHFLSSHMDELTMDNVVESMHQITGSLVGRTLSPTEETALLRFLRYRISSLPERAEKIKNYLDTNEMISETTSDQDLKVYAYIAVTMLEIELSESEFEKMRLETFGR